MSIENRREIPPSPRSREKRPKETEKRDQRHKCKSCHWRFILFSDRKKEEKTMSEGKIIRIFVKEKRFEKNAYGHIIRKWEARPSRGQKWTDKGKLRRWKFEMKSVVNVLGRFISFLLLCKNYHKPGRRLSVGTQLNGTWISDFPVFRTVRK